MKKYTLWAAGLALTLALAPAVRANDQLLSNVSRELHHFVPGVDATSLSHSQLAQIYLIMHSDDTESEKRNLIRSAIGGRFALRGLFLK